MPTQRKIREISELGAILSRLKSEGKKIIQCHGTFDLMHPGHIEYFEEAKKLGDILVVTVTADQFVRKGPNRPVFSQAIRVKTIAALEVVNFVAISHWSTAVVAIKVLKPDIYVKGLEFKDLPHLKRANPRLYEEIEAVAAIGGKVKYVSGIIFSSTKLLKENFGIS